MYQNLLHRLHLIYPRDKNSSTFVPRKVDFRPVALRECVSSPHPNHPRHRQWLTPVLKEYILILAEIYHSLRNRANDRERIHPSVSITPESAREKHANVCAGDLRDINWKIPPPRNFLYQNSRVVNSRRELYTPCSFGTVGALSFVLPLAPPPDISNPCLGFFSFFFVSFPDTPRFAFLP